MELLTFQIFCLFPLIVLSNNIAPPNIWVIHSSNSNQDVEILSETPNSIVVLRKDQERVELACQANYPVKWEYLYQNVSVPILETKYHRIAPNHTDYSNYTFVTTVTLRGLHEYQTGKYICRFFNQRHENNSYNVSSYFNIFVPGNRIISETNHVSFVNKCDLAVVVRCPVSNPESKIKLFKLNEPVFNKTMEIRWKRLYSLYDPTEGFILKAGLGRELLGTYNCTAGGNNSIISIIADIEEKEHYKDYWNMNECFQNTNFMKLVRSKRLECYCKDSYGRFVNDNYKDENRKARCDNWVVPQNCSDWRIQEFFDNGEDSENSCYFDPRPFNGTGSRVEMMATKTEYQIDDQWMTNISVIFNGFDSWASGAQLGIRRKSQDASQGVQIISQDPSYQTHFPLAQNRAGWNNVTVPGNDILSVHVFQPDGLSYDWFELSTDVFQNYDTQGVDKFLPENPKEESQSSSSNYLSINFSCILFLVIIMLNV